MSNLYTNAEIKAIGITFNAYDERYIDVVNDGTVERRYLKPLLNDFYALFTADQTPFTEIKDDIKQAVAFLVIEKAIAKNGKSKTQNLGELTNFTNKSKQATSEDVNIKRDEFYTDAVMLLLDVAKELIANPTDYTGFDEKKAILEVSFRSTTGLV